MHDKPVCTIVYLENAWNSKQMITEGEAAIPLETTRLAFGNHSQSKQKSALVQELKYIAIGCKREKCIRCLFFDFTSFSLEKIVIVQF